MRNEMTELEHKLGDESVASLGNIKILYLLRKRWHGAWIMEHVVRSGPNYTCGREPARLAENNTPGPTAKG